MRDAGHKLGVRDAVEIPTQVRVDDLRVPGVEQRMDLLHGVQRAPSLAVSVLFRLQVGLEDRLQDQQRSHLHDTILYRRNPQRPLLAVRLGNEHPPHGLRTIRLLAEFLRQFAQPPHEPVRRDIVERLAIDSRRPFIGLAAQVRVVQYVRPIHLVVQRVETVVGRPLRFGVQRLL
jgi:hypothetical protein